MGKQAAANFPGNEAMVEVVNTLAVVREDAAAVNSKTQRTLYAARVKIHPKAVQGTFRRLKWVILTAALAVYYVLPWLRWDRGVHAPDQAVLVDLAHRRFYFFFIEIWPGLVRLRLSADRLDRSLCAGRRLDRG
mgnify:CR=1 FL=1